VGQQKKVGVVTVQTFEPISRFGDFVVNQNSTNMAQIAINIKAEAD